MISTDAFQSAATRLQSTSKWKILQKAFAISRILQSYEAPNCRHYYLVYSKERMLLL
jgi:hypothetical protein